MPVDVPTIEEFNALTDRVTALEQGQTPTPIPPDPNPPEPTTGVQAKRIANGIELFGVNTFSSNNPDANLWGSWPADYSPPSVIAALKHITEGSGFAFRLREYHYQGREDMQRKWLSEIVAALPGTRVAICPGANADVNCVPTMFSLANDPACGIRWVEGLNEPNTDFGSGEVPVEQTKAIQDAVWAGAEGTSHRVLGPSIVAGMPHPEGWVTGYCGADLPAINLAMHDGNGHYYPPSNPDPAGTGHSTDEYVGGLWTAYAKHPIDLTEFHPTLYNSQGCKPDEPGWSGDRDAFYTLLTLLRCGKNGTMGLWWYALFDYGTSYICGLFPKCGTDAPRPAATALKNLCAICADPSDTARSFSPGKLDVTVEGLPAGAAWDLYQASDGRFILPLWSGAKEPGGAETAISIEFATKVRSVELFDPLASAATLCPAEVDVTETLVGLPAGVRVLVIQR
jgi:hypothetical protein